MTNYTPGPWFNGTDRRKIESKDGTIVCVVRGSVSHPNVLPDAQLIAAAPELYEALEGTISMLEPTSWDDFNDDELSVIDQAHKALAKARGEINEY